MRESANSPQVRCNEEDKAGIDTMKVKPSLDTAGCQELSVCLGILGPALDELRLEYCGTQLFTSKSLRTLWTCPGLRSLNLDDFNFSLDAEDIRVGLQHLRCAAHPSKCMISTASCMSTSHFHQ